MIYFNRNSPFVIYMKTFVNDFININTITVFHYNTTITKFQKVFHKSIQMLL